jgi:hypothetical protein
MRDQVVITDALVQDFIDNLKKKRDPNGNSRYENSIIVITSDHGMSSMKDGNHSIDIRMELNNSGYGMRAKDRHINKEYNSSGVYDYCFSEGPVAYLYGIDDNKIDDIADFIRFNIDIDGENPVAGVYIGGALNSLFGGPPEPSTTDPPLEWPEMIVVFKPNYAAYIYGDEIEVGANAFHLEIDLPDPFMETINLMGGTPSIKSVPGEHGCWEERHVLCIMIGPGIEEGAIKGPPPMGVGIGYHGLVGSGGAAMPGGTSYFHNIVIAPTICELNNWTIPDSFQGNSVFWQGPSITLNTKYVGGRPDVGAATAEFFYSPDLIGGGGTYPLAYDEDASDGFSAEWDANSKPKGDYLFTMIQYPPGGGPPISIKNIHVFSASTTYGQILLHDNFDIGEINDWTIHVDNGVFELDNISFQSSPYSLKMVSQGEGYAWGKTHELPIDTSQDFSLGTYFMVPNSNNHWYPVLDTNCVHIVIDYSTNLIAWQGTHGGILPINSLNPGQWYYIRADIHPQTQTYDIYLDGVYITTANFLNPVEEMFPYIRMGDIHSGSYDHGEGFWDGINVCGKYYKANSPPDTPNKPLGQTAGTMGFEYTFISRTNDTDRNSIYYTYDWGDGIIERIPKIGYMPSGEELYASHAWYKQGDYNIKVKATDVYEAESDWSTAAEIQISLPKALLCGLISNRTIKDTHSLFTAQFLLWISALSPNIQLYSNDEHFLMANEYIGYISHNRSAPSGKTVNFIIGFFDSVMLSSTSRQVHLQLLDETK